MGTPPIFLLCKTQGESVIPGLLLLMFFQPLCFFNPSVLRPPPLYLLRKTQGESVIPGLLLPMFFSTPLFFQPLRPSATSPIFCCAKHRGGV